MPTNDEHASARIAELEAQLARLERINQALIERVEAGSSISAVPYAAFEHSAALTEQVRERTAELSDLNRQLRDEIHERKAAEHELTLAKQAAEQANVSKTRFLVAISHDLLQPLNAARLFSAALQEQAEHTPLQNLSGSIGRSLNNIDRLLGTLVDISRLEAGVMQPDVGVFPLSQLLDNLAEEHAIIARHAGLQFHHQVCQLPVRSDITLLARVLRNFLSNAIRYTPPGGRVLLGCRRRGGQVEIQVWDTGPGIPDDKRLAIFEEFQRLNTPQTDDRGLGLGLAIVDRIAHLLNHPVQVQSQPGHGSWFSITVPISKERQPQPDQNRTQPIGFEGLHGARIWCLENDSAIRDGMRALLSGWGAHLTAASAVNTLADQVALHRDPVDVLMVDYHLDHERLGTDVASALLAERRQHGSSVPPVLVITADYSQALTTDLKQRGYVLLNKPVKPLKLRAALLHLLQQSEP